MFPHDSFKSGYGYSGQYHSHPGHHSQSWNHFQSSHHSQSSHHYQQWNRAQSWHHSQPRNHAQLRHHSQPWHRAGGYREHPYKLQMDQQWKYDGDRLFSDKKKDPSCGICYNEVTNTKYYHHHDSSQLHRELARKSSRDGMFFCFMCKKREPVERPVRRKVIISGSTLAGCWEHDIFNIDSHVDIEIIVGGKVSDGCRAWRRQYGHLPEPCDVIIVLGINNIGAGQSIEEVMNEIKDFRDCVKEHSVKFKHEQESTFSAGTVIQPPKYMCFDELNPYAHLTNGRNKKLIIEGLNKEIVKFNQEMGVWAPRLHIFGMKVKAKKGIHIHHDLHKDYNQEEPSWWKEPELHKRLHFTKVRRAQIAMKVAKQFDEIQDPAAKYGEIKTGESDDDAVELEDTFTGEEASGEVVRSVPTVNNNLNDKPEGCCSPYSACEEIQEINAFLASY